MLNKKDRLEESIKRLKVKYKNEMKTSLRYSNRWELLVATMLSAQSQDKQVNKVTGPLFDKYDDTKDYIKLKPSDLYPYIKSLGLYKNKAKNIINSAKLLATEFGYVIPNNIKQLTTLPGVGRKTANVVLSSGFGINEGIAIDTHCITVSSRLGIVNTRDPKKIEKKLVELLPSNEWANLTHLFIALGRDACTARVKYCYRCVLNDICPSSNVK